MPENAAATIGLGGIDSGNDGFTDSIELVIPGKNFRIFAIIAGEANEVPQNVKETLFFQHTFKKHIKIGKGSTFGFAVNGFPLHKTIFAGGNRADTGFCHIAHDTESIVNEE